MNVLTQAYEELQTLDEEKINEALDFIRFLKSKMTRFDPNNPPMDAETRKALEDARQGRNLYGPYKSAKEAVAAMLED
jgi:hypothetical protein